MVIFHPSNILPTKLTVIKPYISPKTGCHRIIPVKSCTEVSAALCNYNITLGIYSSYTNLINNLGCYKLYFAVFSYKLFMEIFFLNGGQLGFSQFLSSWKFLNMFLDSDEPIK